MNERITSDQILQWLNTRCRLVLQDANVGEFYLFPVDLGPKITGSTLQDAVIQAIREGR